MRILIVGAPRSRTSYIANACAKHYNITNYHEEFDSSLRSFYERCKLIKKPIIFNEVNEKKQAIFEKKNKELFENQGFVIKLFPRHIINLKHSDKILKNTDDLVYTVISNISEVLRLKEYDLIYCMHRNFLDAAISFAYGAQIESLLFLKNQQVKSKKVIIEERVIHELNYFLLETLVFEELQKFMNSQYKCINLDYTKAVNYVETEFPNHIDHYQDPQFNYKELILNYDEISEHIIQFHKLLQSKKIAINLK